MSEMLKLVAKFKIPSALQIDRLNGHLGHIRRPAWVSWTARHKILFHGALDMSLHRSWFSWQSGKRACTGHLPWQIAYHELLMSRAFRGIRFCSICGRKLCHTSAGYHYPAVRQIWLYASTKLTSENIMLLHNQLASAKGTKCFHFEHSLAIREKYRITIQNSKPKTFHTPAGQATGRHSLQK